MFFFFFRETLLNVPILDEKRLTVQNAVTPTVRSAAYGVTSKVRS